MTSSQQVDGRAFQHRERTLNLVSHLTAAGALIIVVLLAAIIGPHIPATLGEIPTFMVTASPVVTGVILALMASVSASYSRTAARIVVTAPLAGILATVAFLEPTVAVPAAVLIAVFLLIAGIARYLTD